MRVRVGQRVHRTSEKEHLTPNARARKGGCTLGSDNRRGAKKDEEEPGEPSQPADTGTIGTSSGLGSSRRAKPPPCRCDCAASPGEEEEDEEKQPKQAGQWERESSGSISVIADRWLRSLVFSVRLFASRDAALCFIEASFLFNLYLNTSLTQTELRQVMWGEGGAVMPPPCSELQLRSGSFSFFCSQRKSAVSTPSMTSRCRHSHGSFFYLCSYFSSRYFVFISFLFMKTIITCLHLCLIFIVIPTCVHFSYLPVLGICQYNFMWLFHTRVWDSSQFKRLMKTVCRSGSFCL